MDRLRVFIGVDPGASGSMICLGEYDTVDACKMPDNEVDVWRWFEKWSPDTRVDSVAVIESVHAMPGNGVASMFKFGMGYGGLRMALTAAKIPFEAVQPHVWQKALGIQPRRKHDKERKVRITKGKNKGKFRIEKYGGDTDSEWKNILKNNAQALFPKISVTLATADALLIARYCQLKYEGKL